MKKLLFYIDKSFYHFGIANILQNYPNFNMSVIYDVNYIQKKDFLKQKLVKFSKTWFLQDEIKVNTENIDIKYLEEFEKREKIDLWKLAYTERLFLNYNQYYQFSEKEILSILEKQCKFFEKIFDEFKPDYLLMRVTDWSRNHLLALLCKSKKIPVLMFCPSRLSLRCNIGPEFDQIYFPSKEFELNLKNLDEIKHHIKNKGKSKEFSSIVKRGEKISIFTKIKLFFLYMKILGEKDYKEFYENFGRSQVKVIINELSLEIKSKSRKRFLEKKCESIPNKPYVYFPLQFEPERDLLILSPFFTNQLEIIKQIARSLPIGFVLCVKEHPVMRIRNWRDVSFYKEILKLPNVKLIHFQISGNELIKKSKLVISINGSSSLEALIEEKPSIIFIETSFSDIKGIKVVKDVTQLPLLIKELLITSVDKEKVVEYFNYILKNTFELNFTELHNKIWIKFFYQKFFADNSISMKKIEEFFKENNQDYEILTKEYLKMIELLDVKVDGLK
jgi:hypothetical protein